MARELAADVNLIEGEVFMSAFVVLLLGIVFVVVSIAIFKFHPFFALLLSAILVGILSPVALPDASARAFTFAIHVAAGSNSVTVSEESMSTIVLTDGEGRAEQYRIDTLPGHGILKLEGIPMRVGDIVSQTQIDANHLTFEPNAGWSGWTSLTCSASKKPQATLALANSARAFGDLAGKIGIVIALAAVIGQALMESGAADRITRRLLGFVGENRANYALLGSGYILSVPVFFDTVFFLLVPLARALRMRTGHNFVLYVLAVCAGAAITHSLVPPTPGPLVMVEYLNLDLGQTILGGFLLGLPIAFVGGILVPKFLIRWVDPPMRDAPGTSKEEIEAIVQKPDSELPGFLVSCLPVVLPVLLITTDSILVALRKLPEQTESYYEILDSVLPITSFLGDKLFALGLGTVIALFLLARQKGYSVAKLMDSLEPAILMAGNIILITCAGGAFGSMLKLTGLGDEIREVVASGEGSGWVLILVAWGVASVMKTAQGSGTVAMITAASIMGGIIEGVPLPYHPIYIFAAIAYGSKCISWMNDSGFWVVCKMSAFTQEETLKTWTLVLFIMGVLGLLEVLVLSRFLPLV